MAVMVTGAGMVGCQIARLLVEKGERPVLFELAPQMDNIANIVDPARIKIVRGDVLEPLEIMKAVEEEGIDRIIHTATLFGLTVGMQQRAYAGVKLNIMGLANILEVARLKGLKRVVFTSSNTVYLRPRVGNDGDTLNEDFPVWILSGRSPNIYATTKLAAEMLGLSYHDIYKLDFIAVRYAAAFGPWRGAVSGVISARIKVMLDSALAGHPVVVDLSELGEHKLDLVYSKDAARGTVLACFAPNPVNRVYNLTMGKMYTLLEVAQALKEAIPGVAVKIAGKAPDVQPGYPMIQKPCDISRARGELGYEPEYDLPLALRDYAQWLKAQR